MIMGITSNLQAKHIIGGDMYYVCNGNGTYTITMKVYRDCNSGGAQYDNPGYFQIYNGSTAFGNTIQAPPTNIVTIPPDNDPCYEVTNPPCVQSATYTFTTPNLPFSNQGYTIAYQRCCRNETINNIVAPGDAGATYRVEITGQAQQLCNDSPVFNDFPPIVICAGEYIDFDHSASDSDGDSLVYSFCSPLLGGGTEGSPNVPGNPNGPNGVQPIPPTGPPYNTVTFITPTYSSNAPMGGSPTVSIDPQTGIIDGVPTSLGQYVVGVCVREYRNGQFIGEIRRDFQFNVINCTPLVVADIEADSVIGDREFLIKTCGEFTVDIVNESYQQSNIFEYSWYFDFGDGTAFTSDQRDVTITFPALGTYEGIMALNPGTPCADSAKIFIQVVPDIEADFSFAYDTCIAGPVTFTDLSTTGAGSFLSWEWDFGDSNTSTLQHPQHDYQIPGELPATLTVTDINYCSDTKTIPVTYFPAPAVLIIQPDIFEGCVPQDVFYNNLSFPIDDTYDIVWDFGDGIGTSGEISPTYTYTEPGTYTITLDVTSPLGCYIGAEFPNFVTVRPAPIADFTFTPEQLTNFSTTAYFTDQSIDASGWLWTFSDFPAPVLEQNPIHTFQDTGYHEIQLVVRHESGCLDTATAIIEVIPLVTYHLPNAFTPNGDGKNEEFKGVGYFDGMTDFRMTIWNRWGELIFETNDPNESWNGKKKNQGRILQNGVYVVVVEYTEPRGQKIRLKGFATLVR